jgi:hypothetical protein
MDGWRVGRLVILAGGIGMVVITALAAVTDSSNQDLRNRGTIGSLVLSLLLLGVAAWHFWAWGLGKLIAIGLVAAGGVQFTLVDFGDGDMLWEQGFTGFELVARWVLIASAAVVLIGVLLSFVELTRSAGRRSRDVGASVAWWRKWGILVVGVAVALWVLGQIFAETDDAPPFDIEDEGDDGPVQDDDRRVAVEDDVWSIDVDADGVGVHIIHMHKTFGAVEEADIEDLGGRLVWPETEIEVCSADIIAVGDGSVRIGAFFPTAEECPGMGQVFDDFGLPETACLFVRSGGIDDEYCAPLTVD